MRNLSLVLYESTDNGGLKRACLLQNHFLHRFTEVLRDNRVLQG